MYFFFIIRCLNFQEKKIKKVLSFVILFSSIASSILAEEDLGFKPFHPTDALLIGRNRPFNPGGEYENK
jgi:hypothetical protein